MSDKLSTQWADCSLQECVETLDSQRIPINSDERNTRMGDIPYYGATGQVGWIDDYLFNEELVLLGEDGAPFFDKTKHIAYLVNGKSWVNNHAHVLRAVPGITSNRFIKFFLNQFNFHEFVNGTTRLKLTQGSMNKIPVLLPPLNEQHRIVAKLDQLLPKVQRCQERLEQVAKILKRFRQSVLAAACSGDYKLVPLSSLGIVSGGLTKNGKRDALPIKMPYLRVANVYANELRLEEIKFIGVVKSEIQRTLLSLNDLLVVEGNGSLEQIGRVALWNGSIPDCLHQNHLIKFRSSGKVLPQFLLLWMMSPQGREKIQDVASSTTGLHTLSISKIENLQIPLPPLLEQQKIIFRVLALFNLADQIEARYQKAKVSIDKLTQSILAKAFRGELVPQYPNDEPAKELLKRIRAQKEKQEPENLSKKRKQRISKAHTPGQGVANG